MSLNLRELREWAPEISDLVTAVREASASHKDSAEFYRSVATFSSWEGPGADAAKTAMDATAVGHDLTAEELASAAASLEHSQEDAEQVAYEIGNILNDATDQPVVEVDQNSNQLIAPNTDFLTEEAAAKVTEKVADLQERIDAVLVRGEQLDADLARAISSASGTADTEVRAASAGPGLLAPGAAGYGTAPANAGLAAPPSSAGHVAGQSGYTAAPAHSMGALGSTVSGGLPGLVPLPPQVLDAFKRTARQKMMHEGVPRDQIEQRLDAAVVAASYQPPGHQTTPQPGGQGFAEPTLPNEQGIKDLLGVQAFEMFKAFWRDLSHNTGGQGAAPPAEMAIGDNIGEVEPPAPNLYNAGEFVDAKAVTTPAADFAGEPAPAWAAPAATGEAPHKSIPSHLVHLLDQPTTTETNENQAP